MRREEKKEVSSMAAEEDGRGCCEMDVLHRGRGRDVEDGSPICVATSKVSLEAMLQDGEQRQG